jgi:hypothetical protein
MAQFITYTAWLGSPLGPDVVAKIQIQTSVSKLRLQTVMQGTVMLRLRSAMIRIEIWYKLIY